MAEEVKIDKQVFQDRLSQFIAAWKADKRSNDGLFGGVGSIVILMGKNHEQTITFQKNNAMHVGLYLQTWQRHRD
jgi:nucleosome binding factor SPN SPT16 subunit